MIAGKRTAIAAGIVAAIVLGLVSSSWLVGRRPNVVLISIDSLRPDHLGCYGYERQTSPTLDRLARDGALFEDVVSSTSWTLPAHAAMFTSLPDRVHGCVDDRHWLDGSRLTLAEAFHNAGYRTSGFFSGPYLNPSFGLSQGFDTYRDCTSFGKTFAERLHERRLFSERGELSTELMDLSNADVTNSIVLAAVRSWFDKRPSGPFFLFIHLWDVHYDFLPPPPYDTLFDPGYRGPVDGRNLLREAKNPPPSWDPADFRHLIALYDGEIRATDETVGHLVAELEHRGLLEKTVVAVTADHGEAFYEHGTFGHRWTLHDEELRIPLLIRYPKAVAAGRRVQESATILDIAPTLLDLAGIPLLPAAEGHSLASRLAPGAPQPPPVTATGLLGGEPAVGELTFPGSGIHDFSLRSASWKVIFDLNSREIQVFDLASDPQEQQPLGRESGPFQLDQLERLYTENSRRLEAAASRLPVPRERDAPPVSRMTLEQLKSLGYIR